MADDEIVVEIEKETPQTNGADTSQPDPVADLKAQYEELQADKVKDVERIASAERRAADEANRRAAAERDAHTVRSEITETRLDTVASGLEAAKTEADAAAAEHSAAMEAGDWKKATDAQRKIARAEARILRLDEAKADLEAAKAAPRTEARTEQRQEAVGDPVENFLSRCEPGTAAWLRAHPDEAKVLATNSDPRRVAKLQAADADAMSEGFVKGSTDYFAHVEKFLGMRKDAAVNTNGKDNTAQNGNGVAKVAQRKASAPVAPVQASAGGTSGGSEVRLSKREADAAQDGTLVWNYDDTSGQKRFKKGDPIGIQEMARRKLAMQGQGLYDKSYVEQ